MATPTTVYINPQQRKRVFQRARRRRTSLSEELRAALEFYLDPPTDFSQEAFSTLVQEAHASLVRSVMRLGAMSDRVRTTGRKLDEIDRRLNELTRNCI